MLQGATKITGQFRQRGKLNRQEILSQPVVEAYVGKDWDGGIRLLAEVFSKTTFVLRLAANVALILFVTDKNTLNSIFFGSY